MLSKFLDPKNDVAFRKIFGTERNKDILIHFLNDMITFKARRPIQEVSFLKTVQDPEIAANKTSIVDVLCKDELGNQYIVEMQVAKEKGFEKRAQYYASKAYISQTRVGGAYHDLKEVIFLAISNYVMFPNKSSYKSDHMILDRVSLECDLKDFSFTFLELPKFDKPLDQLSNIVEKWLYFLKCSEETSEEDLCHIIGKDTIMERAYHELSRFSWDEAELLTYDQAEKYQWAHEASLEQKFDEGMEKGREVGLIEGMEKGREVGLIEGMEKGEKKARLALAMHLLHKQFPIDQISELTQFSEEELEALKAPLSK